MQVPIIEKQVKEKPLPSIRLSDNVDPNAFGANAANAQYNSGKAMQQFGNTLGDIALKLQEELNINKVLDASNQWALSSNELMKEGVQKSGKNAVGLTKDFGQKLEENLKEVEKSLDNDRQRQMFKQQIASRHVANINTLSMHEAKQLKEYRVNAATESLGVNLQAISQSYNNQEIVEANIASGLAAIDTLQNESGLDKTSRIVKFKNDSRVNVVNGYIVNKQPELAMEYYKIHKSDFVDPVAVQEKIQKQTDLNRFITIADNLYLKYGKDGERQALAEAKKLYPNPVDYKRQEDMISSKYSNERRLANQDDDNRFTESLNILEGISSYADAARMIESTSFNDPRHKLTLQNIVKVKFGIDESGRPKHTPLNTWMQAIIKAETDPNYTLPQFLTDFGNKMSESDIKTFSKSILNGESKMSWTSILKEVGGVTEKDIPLFLDRVTSEQKVFTDRNGRPPNNEERYSIVKNAKNKIITDSKAWYGGNSTSPIYKTDLPADAVWDDGAKRFKIYRDGKWQICIPSER